MLAMCAFVSRYRASRALVAIDHGASTAADESGHYTLKVPTRGAVTVSAVIGNRHASHAVRLTGARSYALDIEEINECVENCGE